MKRLGRKTQEMSQRGALPGARATARPPLLWHLIALALAGRARRAACIVVAPYPMGGRYTGERPLFAGVRPWFDVRAAASSLRSRLSGGTRGRATAHAVSREGAHHARLQCTCAVLRVI